MPWIINTWSARRLTGSAGDVLIPVNTPVEIPDWAYALVSGEYGITDWTPGTPVTEAAVFTRELAHAGPGRHNPHEFDNSGGVPDTDEAEGGLPV